MSTAIAEIIAESDVDPNYLAAKHNEALSNANAIQFDEKGEQREVSESERIKFDLLMEDADKYKAEHEAALERQKGRQDAARMDKLKSFGKGIEPPKVDPNLEDLAGDTPAVGAKSPLAHLLGNPDFVKAVHAGLNSDGNFQIAGKSESFSAGNVRDFMASLDFKALISTLPDAEDAENPSSILWTAEGRYLGGYTELAAKLPQRKDLEILDCFNRLVIPNKYVRWLEWGYPMLNVGVHEEKPTKEETKSKPYSMLAPVKEHEQVLKTIAHMFCATQCAFDSIDRLEEILNDWGRYGLLKRLCESLLSGDPAANPETDPFVGLLNTPGIGSLDSSDGVFGVTDPTWEKVMYAKVALKQKNFTPTKLLMNCMTATKAAIESTKDDGCCVAQFINPVTGEMATTIAGCQVVESEEIADNQIVAGDFSARTNALFTNGDVNAAFTDSNRDHFEKNIVDWRFEMNAGLAIRCPEGFVVLDTKA